MLSSIGIASHDHLGLDKECSIDCVLYTHTHTHTHAVKVLQTDCIYTYTEIDIQYESKV